MTRRFTRALLWGSLALLWGCPFTNGRLVYTSFGAADPAADSRLVESWDKSRVAPDSQRGPYSDRELDSRELTERERRSVVVLVDTIPEGIESSSSGLRSEGHHRILGKFSISYRSSVNKAEILDDVRLVAMASGGNMALITWPGNDQDSARGVGGVIVAYDMARFNSAKNQSGKIPSI